jgi:hypothetical protein
MRLTDLAPRWWGTDSRVLGVSFRCPHCQLVRLGIAFANPADGGEPSAIVTQAGMPQAIRDLLHETVEFDVPPGHLWTRTGETFDNLTLTPSVDASASGHWHGSVTNGEAT